MNEQHIDALPPVQANPNADQNQAMGETGASVNNDQPSAPAPSGGFVDPLAVQATSGQPSHPTQQSTPQGTATPQIADDIDLIEKEWVDKAKQIVEQTKHDPYQQNQAMTGVKADYLKKRYGRDIKMGES